MYSKMAAGCGQLSKTFPIPLLMMQLQYDFMYRTPKNSANHDSMCLVGFPWIYLAVGPAGTVVFLRSP